MRQRAGAHMRLLPVIVLLAGAEAWSVADERSRRPALRTGPDSLYRKVEERLRQGDYEAVLRTSEQALSSARRTGDLRGQARALSLIGNAQFYLDRRTEALAAFQEVLRLTRFTGDRPEEATALKDVGITLKLLGRFDEAEAFISQSLNIFRELNNISEIGSALENLGTGYAALGAYNLAFEMYQQALENTRQAQNPSLLFGTLIRLGELHNEVGNPARALEHATQALNIAEENRLSLLDQTWAMQVMSDALSDLGRADSAIEVLQRSLALCRRIGSKSGLAHNLLGLGRLHLDRDPDAAVDYYRKALAILEEVGSERRLAYIGLARAYRVQGDRNRSIEFYERAIEQLESYRGLLAMEDDRATFIGKHLHAYHEMVESLMDRHQKNPERLDNVRAFAVFEQAKARALLEAVTRARPGVGLQLDPDLQQKRHQVAARMTDLQKRAARPGLAREERRQIIDQLSQTEHEFDRLRVEINRRRPRHAALDPLTSSQAQALLDEPTALLAYFVTENRVFAFILTSSSFHAEQLPVTSRVVAARVQNYLSLVAQDENDGWQAVSRRLHDELLSPLLEHLPHRIHHLIIIPDAMLHYLPFETLIYAPREEVTRSAKPAGRGPGYLLERFVISYAPSATVLAALRASHSTPELSERADLMAIANPLPRGASAIRHVAGKAVERVLYDDEGLEPGPIPYSSAEVTSIARYARRGSVVLTGSGASERRVKAEQLHRFRVLHFATHGLISQRTPHRSALVLAASEGDGEDGFLQAREIYDLSLSSDLVVLSGCQTARGRILAGEGVQGLAQAFFYAGARSLVATLWNVNDERTAAFMGRFYRHLANGKSKAAALREAKLDLIRDRSASSPRYWAPFILIGEPTNPVPISGPSGRSRQHLWLLAVVVLLMSVVVILILGRARRIG